MTKKIHILGGTGYLGAKLAAGFAAAGWDVAAPRVEIRDLSALRAALAESRPDVVLNAAGVTGTPNVDWCESHRAETAAVNVSGALLAALAAEEVRARFVHVGSGCVYSDDSGKSVFSETDPPNFTGSFYSLTKAHAEQLLARISGVLQLRVRIPVSAEPSSKNVIDKLRRYEKIISVMNSFTVVEDFIPATIQLVERGETGIWNMTNVGAMDHEWLMTQYREIVDPGFCFTVMTLDELGKYAAAPRSNCILDSSKREALGISMPDIRVRIPEILRGYRERLAASGGLPSVTKGIGTSC